MIDRELILYILENHLEDADVFFFLKMVCLSVFLTAEEAAAKFDVGIETIRIWIGIGLLKAITIGDVIYVLVNATPTRIVR